MVGAASGISSVPARKLLTGNSAAAWGARLARVDYVPAFPITPQTEIIETLAGWCHDGTLPARFVTLDSEHSMLTAAGAAAVTGVRVFTATSSQGLLHGMESLYTVAGWRAPFVLVNVSRALSSPITLGPDHNDILAARDSGFLQIHAETCQEVLDFVLMAFRLAEDENVQLPMLVNLDGFFLSFTREPVQIPSQEQVDAFLPAFAARHPTFRASQPVAHGVAVMDPGSYSYFRYQVQRGFETALDRFDEIAHDFEVCCGRRYQPLELHRMEDAEVALVMIGSFSTRVKAAISRWRAQGRRVGLVRLRLLRPLPARDLVSALAGLRAVGVIDQNLSPGLGGILYHEVAATVAGSRAAGPVLRSFISGLGGKEISDAELDHILATLEKASLEAPSVGRSTTAVAVAPELLLTEDEWRRHECAQQIAGKAEVAP